MVPPHHHHPPTPPQSPASMSKFPSRGNQIVNPKTSTTIFLFFKDHKNDFGKWSKTIYETRFRKRTIYYQNDSHVAGVAFQRRTGSRGAFFEAFFESQEFSCPAPGVEFYTTSNTTFKKLKRAKKVQQKKGWWRGACAPRRRKKRREVSAGSDQPIFKQNRSHQKLNNSILKKQKVETRWFAFRTRSVWIKCGLISEHEMYGSSVGLIFEHEMFE